MLICGCAGSRHSRCASGDKSSFFFQPVQLHLELPNLLVSLRLKRLVVVLALRASCRENLGHLLVETMFPMRNLRRMHTIGTGEFVDRFEPFEGFQRHTGFELCAVLLPLCRHLSSPLPLLWTQHSILITCPVFGVHYTLPEVIPPPRCTLHLEFHGAFAHTDLLWKTS